MAADIQEQGLKALWQDQEPETDPVTLAHVHSLARKLDRKTRFTPVIIGLGLIATGYLGGYLWVIARDWLQQVAAILFVTGEVGCFAAVYRALFPSRDPAMPASAFLRRRLQRGLYYLQGGWAWALAPMLPFVLIEGYSVFKNSHAPLWANVAPFVVMAVLVIFVAVRAMIGARQTRAQLQELNELLER